ncbi:MAG: NADH:flavin oxidoreductase/NADH oxidase [Salinirussus sp.]
MHLFTSFECREVTARNRVMVSPMCQYSCEAEDGLATPWHHVHLGSRAVGGAGIVMAEATAIAPDGRISPRDLGLWSDEHGAALAETADFVAAAGAVPGIQLAHAGRKASTRRPADGGGPIHDERGWTPVGPTTEPWPHRDAEPLPTEELSPDQISDLVDDWAAAAERAVTAGFEIIEIHAAHGYLLHEFLSPAVNTRTDEYGGDFEGRSLFLREVIEAVRAVLPEGTPLFVRISATDWLPDRDSWTPDDAAQLAEVLEPLGVDLIDVSAGGIAPGAAIPETGPHYQVPFAERVAKSGVAVGAVGKITTPEGADEIIRNDRAALSVIGREHLRDPYFALHAAEELGHELPVPRQYQRAF